MGFGSGVRTAIALCCFGAGENEWDSCTGGDGGFGDGGFGDGGFTFGEGGGDGSGDGGGDGCLGLRYVAPGIRAPIGIVGSP